MSQQHNSSSSSSSSGAIIDQYLKQIYEQVRLGLNLEESNHHQPLDSLQHYGLAVQSIGSILQSKELIQHLSLNQLASLKMIYEKCTERVIALLNVVKNPSSTISTTTTANTTTNTSTNTNSTSNTTTNNLHSLTPQSQKKPEYFGIVKHYEEKVYNSPIDQLNDQFNFTKSKLLKLDNEQAELVKKINESNQTGNNYLKMKRKYQEKSRIREQIEKELFDIDTQRASYYNQELEQSNANVGSEVGGISESEDVMEDYFDIGPKEILKSNGCDTLWIQFIMDNYPRNHKMSPENEEYEKDWLSQLSNIHEEQELYYLLLGYILNIDSMDNHPLVSVFDGFCHKFRNEFKTTEASADSTESLIITPDFAAMYVKEFCSNLTQHLVEASSWKQYTHLSKHKNVLYSVICQAVVSKLEKELSALYMKKDEALLVYEKISELKGISLVDLGADYDLCLEGEYQPIISKFKEITKKEIISEKIILCKDVYYMLTEVVKKHVKHIQERDYEQKLLPVLMYIILKANIPTVYAIFDLAIDFSHGVNNKTIFLFDNSYWEALSLIKTALLHLTTLTHNSSNKYQDIQIDADIEQEFEELVNKETNSSSSGNSSTRNSLEQSQPPSNQSSTLSTSPNNSNKNLLLNRLNKLMKK